MLLYTSGCAAGARGVAGWSPTQIRSLARIIASHSPENVHYAEGAPPRRWVLVKVAPVDSFPALTYAVIAELRTEREVFTDTDSVPVERIVLKDGKVFGYIDGYEFDFKVSRLDGGRFRFGSRGRGCRYGG